MLACNYFRFWAGFFQLSVNIFQHVCSVCNSCRVLQFLHARIAHVTIALIACCSVSTDSRSCRPMSERSWRLRYVATVREIMLRGSWIRFPSGTHWTRSIGLNAPVGSTRKICRWLMTLRSASWTSTRCWSLHNLALISTYSIVTSCAPDIETMQCLCCLYTHKWNQ